MGISLISNLGIVPGSEDHKERVLDAADNYIDYSLFRTVFLIAWAFLW